MKLLLFLVSAATTASVAHATQGLVRQLIERHVQSNEDLQTIIMNFQQSDWTCMIKGAIDEDSCETPDQYDGCVWCPIGSRTGACVSGDQAEAVNGLEIPHLQCGAPSTREDLDFWNTLMGCELQGATSMDCLSNPMCTWCVVEEPAFGLCMSQEFIDESSMLLKEAQDEEGIELDDVLRCRQEPPEDKSVTGLLDRNCIMEGMDKQACVQGVDGAGNLCVWQDSELCGELCLSATQTNVMEFLMETIDSLGLDIDSLVNGDMMFGGDVEIDTVPQLYGDYPDPDEEAVSVSSSNNADQISSGDDYDKSQEKRIDPKQKEYDDEAGQPIASSNINEAAPSEENEDEDEVSSEYEIEMEPYETEMEPVGEEEEAEEESVPLTKAEEPVPPTTHHQEPAVLPKERTKPSLVQSILASAARDGSVQEQTKHNGGGRVRARARA